MLWVFLFPGAVMDAGLIDFLVLASALVGAIAGVAGVLMAWRRDRVRLSVSVSRGGLVFGHLLTDTLDGSQLVITVTNQGLVPVTVRWIRIRYRFSRQFHQLLPDCRFATLPHRLEPRASATFLAPAALAHVKPLHRFECVQVGTECGAQAECAGGASRECVDQHAPASRLRRKQRRALREGKGPAKGGE